MTRFARAKGSKASNERLPEQATSWTEMKQQLLLKNKEMEENKKRQEVLNERNAKYKSFLEEREETESKKTSWADFPVSAESKIKTKESMKKVTLNNNVNINNEESSDEEFTSLRTKVDEVLNSMSKSDCDDNSLPKKEKKENNLPDSVVQIKTKKNKKAKSVNGDQIIKPKGAKKSVVKQEILNTKTDSDSDAPPEEESAKKEVVKPVIKLKKPKQKKLKITAPDSDGTQIKTESTNKETNKSGIKRKISEDRLSAKKKLKKDATENNSDGNPKNQKVKNKGNQKKKIIKENLTEQDLKKIEKKKAKRLKQVLKKKEMKAELKKKQEEIKEKERIEKKDEPNQIQTDTISNEKQPSKDVPKRNISSHNNFNKMKKERQKDDNPSRRKPFLPHKMFINGKELEIEYVEGFPVKKEDAERLKKLRREMISKGLPRSEINIAMKLERRKAEKAFAREKKKVCFNCRKSGHNLSECPELNKDQVAHTAGSGICFKCGSTEHTHFECKVVRGQDYRYAQCFICNEQGHIARQCPDNARGLYPKGGACKVCGDVTHLKKDCPTYQAQQQKQEGSIQIETFGNSNPDALEECNGDNVKVIANKRPNKIIKF